MASQPAPPRSIDTTAHLRHLSILKLTTTSPFRDVARSLLLARQETSLLLRQSQLHAEGRAQPLSLDKINRYYALTEAMHAVVKYLPGQGLEQYCGLHPARPVIVPLEEEPRNRLIDPQLLYWEFENGERLGSGQESATAQWVRAQQGQQYEQEQDDGANKGGFQYGQQGAQNQYALHGQPQYQQQPVPIAIQRGPQHQYSQNAQQHFSQVTPAVRQQGMQYNVANQRFQTQGSPISGQQDIQDNMATELFMPPPPLTSGQQGLQTQHGNVTQPTQQQSTAHGYNLRGQVTRYAPQHGGFVDHTRQQTRYPGTRKHFTPLPYLAQDAIQQQRQQSTPIDTSTNAAAPKDPTYPSPPEASPVPNNSSATPGPMQSRPLNISSWAAPLPDSLLVTPARPTHRSDGRRIQYCTYNGCPYETVHLGHYARHLRGHEVNA
ncbi:uncharacterized protein AB675_10836 [Cyphellophora attinorum]|uniref:Uncharacterized protein n=1 Tax=Cyphellophora attinorum TaxID=1664694 RepID=A0A0N1HAG3_9EURO|nr:uncharacterized protein AB675_10836 [Phialophora attinorum]KPI40976.1 hypothetical protein AB675_10836 [Phialophora attinorum]